MSTPSPAQPSPGPKEETPPGPPDAYGVPETAEFAGVTETQPFPQAEPAAEAPTGTYELDPAEPYEPYVPPGASNESFAPPPAEAPTAAFVPPAADSSGGSQSTPAANPHEYYPAGSYAPPPPPPPPPSQAYGGPGAYGQPGPSEQPYAGPAGQDQQSTAYGQQGSYAPPPAYGQPGAYPQPPAYSQPYQYPQAGYGYPPPYDPLAKSRTIAGILGILLGGLGVHRFYLGYVGIGLAQIAVTIVTFGVGWLWGFVEGILYLTQKAGTYSVDATGRPLRD